MINCKKSITLRQYSEFKSEDAPFMIGRTDKCLIRFKDTSLSRHQCKIDYIGEKWYIRDGDGEKESTNGTWLFADEEIKLELNTIIKAGLSIFNVKVIN